MIVTAEQIKTSGAGFILKTMRTFANGKLGDLIRKLYRRYKRALVQLDMSEGDEEEEEKEEDSNEEVNAEKTVESEDNASFGDGIEDEMCTEEEWRNAEEDLNTEEGGKEDLNTEEGGKETEDNSSFFVQKLTRPISSTFLESSGRSLSHGSILDIFFFEQISRNQCFMEKGRF